MRSSRTAKCDIPAQPHALNHKRCVTPGRTIYDQLVIEKGWDPLKGVTL